MVELLSLQLFCHDPNKLTSEITSLVSAAAMEAGLPESSLMALMALFAGLSAGNFTGVPGITAQVISATEAADAQAATNAFRYVHIR